jgi:hypothetical protein
VFVVSESEKLNSASQNALLKVLEEPPPTCCIILIGTRLEKLLPTIRSRTQVLRFGAIHQERIITHLTEGGAAPEQARFFAALSQGSLGGALTYWRLTQAGADLYAIKRDLVAGVARMTLADTLERVEACLLAVKCLAECWTQIEPETSKTDLSRRAQKTIVLILITLWDDVMRTALIPSHPAVHADQMGEIQFLAGYLSPEAAADRVALGYETLRRIEAGVNEKLVFEWLLLRGRGSGILTGL